MFSLLATFLLLIILSISCTDKDDTDTLPELPPIDALMMDFSDFNDNPTKSEVLKALEGNINFLYSYGTVTIWNILITIPMIVPVAAYLECFNNTPVYLGDNSWQWSYTVTTDVDSYTARLVTQRISNDKFTAEMFVTKAGGINNFKWFEGIIRYDRTHAEWIMYDPVNNVAWLEIEWNKDWEKEISDITYTIVQAGDENGSYITFGITEDTDYDAYYTILYSQKDTYIKWNRDTKEGRVKDEVNFGNADWHCWNELLQDVDCN